MGKKRMPKKLIQYIGQQRIRRLFSLAECQMRNGNSVLANRYVAIARNISMKCLCPIPSDLKHRYCPHCYGYLLPEVTCRVRIHRRQVVTHCFQCDGVSRIPFK